MPDEVFTQISQRMEAAERAGEFDQLFKGKIHPREGPDKDELLHSFGTGMKLYKSTFLKIYGYELTYPGYAEKALSWLEMLGCSKARIYYSGVVAEYEHQHEKEMKSAAHWYKGQCENEFENMKRKAVRESREDLKKMSNSELLTHLESLIAEV